MTKRNEKFEWQSSFIQAGMTGNTGFIGLLVSTLDNGDGQGFFVSAPSIARWTGVSEKTADNQLKALRKAGWLVRTRKGGRRGDRVYSSEYRLDYPEGGYRPKLTSRADVVELQPEVASPQPEASSPQPEAGFPPVDPSLLDHLSLDLSSLSPGDEVTGDQMRALEGDGQLLFVPSFNGIDLWVYEPELRARTSELGREASESKPAPSSADEVRARRRHAYANREEGLDEYGEPLQRRTRSKGYRSREDR